VGGSVSGPLKFSAFVAHLACRVAGLSVTSERRRVTSGLYQHGCDVGETGKENDIVGGMAPGRRGLLAHIRAVPPLTTSASALGAQAARGPASRVTSVGTCGVAQTTYETAAIPCFQPGNRPAGS
jgi:hypothetical protein